jgi:hypothetical protein
MTEKKQAMGAGEILFCVEDPLLRGTPKKRDYALSVGNGASNNSRSVVSTKSNNHDTSTDDVV